MKSSIVVFGSITVTCVSSALKIVAYSIPTTPAPMTTSERGMQTFDMALHNLYKEERITLEEALSNADSRTNLEAKINFG